MGQGGGRRRTGATEDTPTALPAPAATEVPAQEMQLLSSCPKSQGREGACFPPRAFMFSLIFTICLYHCNKYSSSQATWRSSCSVSVLLYLPCGALFKSSFSSGTNMSQCRRDAFIWNHSETLILSAAKKENKQKLISKSHGRLKL